MKTTQKQFLLDQLWKSTLRASLSRAGNVYKAETTKEEKEIFKSKLFEFVSTLIHNNYLDNTPNEKDHVKNISAITNFAISFGFVELRFGHSQKILNLYLKYQWCLGHIHTPPHFPVDRLIQMKLGIPKPSQWTQWDDSKEYLKIIERAKTVARKQNIETIAELELALYNEVEIERGRPHKVKTL
ncbi:hypothetical protein [Arthrospiribacter ruber]|uniref:Uncharacterized protein n=1 Tax=Arthrospiribacter ruber TaxID=2487934 RepID=A0A951MCV6_9BACT|nr:hypothetical protein [Arthrospiribacter ruber]MBW3467907.1 hypothetical protein [Arthrospiribacter ruber]